MFGGHRNFLLGNQDDARFSAFETQADQADWVRPRFIVELLRKPRYAPCGSVIFLDNGRLRAAHAVPKRPASFLVRPRNFGSAQSSSPNTMAKAFVLPP